MEKPLQGFFLFWLNGSLGVLKKVCQMPASVNISFISFYFRLLNPLQTICCFPLRVLIILTRVKNQ